MMWAKCIKTSSKYTYVLFKDYKGLKAKVVEIYRKYVQEENRKKADGVDQQK